jgi:hypothetical protein
MFKAAELRAPALSVMFEELHCPLMRLRGLLGAEGSQISPFAILGILFARVQSILTRFQFANHA